MTRPVEAIIDLAAVRHNYQLAKRRAPGTRAIAVVKANAYGHGAVPVAQGLANADAFAVASLDEALELRAGGIQQPILLLEGFFSTDELRAIARENLWSVVHCQEQLNILKGLTLDKRLQVWLKVDTGMHRLGVPLHKVADIYQALSQLPHVQVDTLMTHFACADTPEHGLNQRQLDNFRQVYTSLTNANIARSLANSAATLGLPSSRGEWTRPGIMLYGASPLAHQGAQQLGLKPVMQLHSRIISVRQLSAGETVGYGADYLCQEPKVVGTVAIGYGDAYPRHAKSGTPVLVQGQRAPLIGRVSMDMINIDLSQIASARVGDPVELWGTHITADEVARCSETIAYELFTCIPKRVSFRYINA